MRVVTDAIFGDHLRGIGHPESPDRVEVVASFLRERGALRDALVARDADDAELLAVHSRAYLDTVEREVHDGMQPRYLSTGDVVIDERSLAVARRAAGGAIAALEHAVAHDEPAFALVRPPGHHAEAQRGMGFCLFNNAAVAARACAPHVGGDVVVIDFDYHHGNGTQDVVGNGLSYVSTHASPAYPGTGSTSIARPGGVAINVPLPVSGATTEAFVALWDALLDDIVRNIKPGAIVVSAGYDMLAGDPVGDLGVELAACAYLAGAIERCAAALGHRRIAYVLEGGYNIASLCAAVEATLNAPMMDPQAQRAAIGAAERRSLEKARALVAATLA